MPNGRELPSEPGRTRSRTLLRGPVGVFPFSIAGKGCCYLATLLLVTLNESVTGRSAGSCREILSYSRGPFFAELSAHAGGRVLSD